MKVEKYFSFDDTLSERAYDHASLKNFAAAHGTQKHVKRDGGDFADNCFKKVYVLPPWLHMLAGASLFSPIRLLPSSLIYLAIMC